MNKVNTLFGAFILVLLLASCSGNKKPDKKSNNDSIPDSNATNNVGRTSADFADFIDYFLKTCYYNNNIDSLVYKTSSTVTDFIHTEAGLSRYFNRGAFCNLFSKDNYDYPFSGDYYGEPCKFSGLSLYNRKPMEGYCEESPDSNGVYYYSVTEFPQAWDMEQDKPVKVGLPAKFDKVAKMKVDIMFAQWIAKQFYFAQIDNIWYLVFIDDCDCSV